MIMLGPLGPSARARVPWSFVAPRAHAVLAFVRPRFGTAPVAWDLAIVDPLLVARLDAKSLLGSAGRLVVALIGIVVVPALDRGLLRPRRERPRSHRAAEGSQQFPPCDGDCHTPLPCEVRKRNDTTSTACSLHAKEGGHLSRRLRVVGQNETRGKGKISSASSHDRSGRGATSGLSCARACTVSPQSKLTCLS